MAGRQEQQANKEVKDLFDRLLNKGDNVGLLVVKIMEHPDGKPNPLNVFTIASQTILQFALE